MNYQPVFYNDLNLTLEYIFSEVAVAVKHPKHDLHQVYVSSYGIHYPEVRTVILRKQNLSEGELVFHTDIRSQKFQDFTKNSAASILGYNVSKKYQIRCRGKIKIHHFNEVANEAWQSLSPQSKKPYQASISPGKELTSLDQINQELSSHSQQPEGALKNMTTESFGLNNFVVCVFQTSELEWLYLHPDGHRRALYTFKSNNIWSQLWLAP